MGKRPKKSDSPSAKAISYLYVLLITLLITAFLVFMILLLPLMTHPSVPRNVGTTMFLLVIALTLLTGVTGMLVFAILEKKKVV
ncbi:hypothetical protein A3K63_04250 [Candidatus Micrarchaeota archaeon RBG_16_49_10]|nr:MAG: hypothetical protein A3K63_04250 [Candidatus Micrarchaeota archaeon RBG_16_49_10]